MKIHDTTADWVYNLADYHRIFDLSDVDLSKSILDYPGGISSFNVEMQALGHQVVSADASYDLTLSAMQQQAQAIISHNEEYLRTHQDYLKDSSEAAMGQIIQVWRDNMQAFLADYKMGRSQGRYKKMTLPKLSAADHEFQLALCSDMLFHSQLHRISSIESLVSELCRAAHEVRIFPLLNEKGEMTEVLGPLMLTLQQQNYGVEVREVPYEKKKGGNAMLRIWATKCVVEAPH